MSPLCNTSKSCTIKPSYGGGSISSLPNRGGSIVPDSPLYEDNFLIDEFLNFIVTEANEKIIIGQTEIGGEFGATIDQTPEQGGSITPQLTQNGSIGQLPKQGGSLIQQP